MPAPVRPLRLKLPGLIEIGACPLVVSPALRYLDAAKLEGAERAEIEVGVIEGTCCSRTVRATVEHGSVTSFAVDGCSDGKDEEALHPELQKLLKAAVREAKKRRRGQPATLPMPVKTLLAKPEAAITLHCYCICVFGSMCWLCCPRPDDFSSYSCSRW